MRTLPSWSSVAVASMRAPCMLLVTTNVGVGVGVGVGLGVGVAIELAVGLAVELGLSEGDAVLPPQPTTATIRTNPAKGRPSSCDPGRSADWLSTLRLPLSSERLQDDVSMERP